MKIFKKILVPVDFSEESADALRYSHFLSKEMDAELIVLHVFDKREDISVLEPYALLEGWPFRVGEQKRIPVDVWVREKCLDLYNFVQKKLRRPDMGRIKREVRIGKTAAKEILAVAKQEAIDLIVLPLQKRSLLSYMTLSGTLLNLIRRSRFPVLLAPSASENERASRPFIFLPS
ncbi:MAG: universal stress protein [Deltaproteobacteria bacterium]|nr:universal stress protein [Deltaproteobacteria bacterium]